MKFSFGERLTVDIPPIAWVAAAALGFPSGRGDPLRGAVWAAAVLLAILLHELGHAGASLAFGSGADAVLGPFGGVTRPRDPASFKKWQSFLMTAAGCATGLATFAAVLAAFRAGLLDRLSPAAEEGVKALAQVSLILSLFNLLPIQPMDGGRLLAMVLRARFGLAGVRASHVIGLATAAAAAAGAFWLLRDTFAALFAVLFGVGEARALRRSFRMSPLDLDGSAQAELSAAQALWARGEKEAALAALGALRERAKTGDAHDAAVAQTAGWLFASGRVAEAYPFLKEVPEERMSPALRRALQEAALQAGDYAASLSAGQNLFHRRASPEVAALLAEAYRRMGDAERAAQWDGAARRLKDQV